MDVGHGTAPDRSKLSGTVYALRGWCVNWRLGAATLHTSTDRSRQLCSVRCGPVFDVQGRNLTNFVSGGGERLKVTEQADKEEIHGWLMQEITENNERSAKRRKKWFDQWGGGPNAIGGGGGPSVLAAEYTKLARDFPSLTRVRLHRAHLLWRHSELHAACAELSQVREAA